ncbi:glycosyltransferase involved in cell wall biosynthesis [Pelomonas saccharophila]|uniref:Glycosyltransferase involved in cell wall biosynthesis n=1 Tax=Roseateles saccharophilus TaxID=304 RepID=A0ABU1YFE7_ROSSA|nr:glycosyltransferase family 4 protein [Roseateles saccharophilus]MDR7267572.1 glycosyltransferase involved in cell wall biosynthesis [Roseateles saccharophilus]
MRIAHLLFTKRFAGSERYAIELANAQAEHHEVCFLLNPAAAEDRPDAWAGRLDPRVQQVRLGLPWLMPATRAARWARAWRPDVCHAHLSYACKALSGMPAAGVATLHIAYKARQHAHLDGLIAITPQQLAQIPADYAGRVAQISNWSEPRTPAAGARERLRAAWGVAPQDLLIGTLGRGEYSKGWDLLVEAFMRARLPDARLVLVGEGPEWNAVRVRAPAEVVMPGFTNEPENCLAAFDVFVSAARSEPFGLVFLEAMHAGLPIVATATEGATYLGGSFEALTPCGDAAELAVALARVSESRSKGEDLRRLHPVERFGRAARAAEIEDFYRDCIAARRRRSIV